MKWNSTKIARKHYLMHGCVILYLCTSILLFFLLSSFSRFRCRSYWITSRSKLTRYEFVQYLLFQFNLLCVYSGAFFTLNSFEFFSFSSSLFTLLSFNLLNILVESFSFNIYILTAFRLTGWLEFSYWKLFRLLIEKNVQENVQISKILIKLVRFSCLRYEIQSRIM